MNNCFLYLNQYCFSGPWSACSEKCGNAKQYRSVTCRSEKNGEEGKLLPADSCSLEIVLERDRSCNLGPCEGLYFHTTEWNFVSKFKREYNKYIIVQNIACNVKI